MRWSNIHYRTEEKGGMNDYFMIRTLEEERKEAEKRAKEKED